MLVSTGSKVVRDEALKERDELVARHEAVRVRATVFIARHDRSPVGRVQTKGVPPLGAPGLADPAPLQHAVPQPSLGQIVACAQPGPSGADHDYVEIIGVGGHRRILPRPRRQSCL